MKKNILFKIITLTLVLSIFSSYAFLTNSSYGVKEAHASPANINAITGLFRTISALNARNRVYGEAHATAEEVNAYYDAQIATAQRLRDEMISKVAAGEASPTFVRSYIRATAALEAERQAMIESIEQIKREARREFQQRLTNEIKHILITSPGGQTILSDVRETIQGTREAAVVLQNAAREGRLTASMATDYMIERLRENEAMRIQARVLGSKLGRQIERVLDEAVSRVNEALEYVEEEMDRAVEYIDGLDSQVEAIQNQEREPVSLVGNRRADSILTNLVSDRVGVDAAAIAFTIASERSGNHEPGETRVSMFNQIRSTLRDERFNELISKVKDLRPGFVYCRNTSVSVYERAANDLGMAVQIARNPDQAKYLVCYDIESHRPVLASILGEVATIEEQESEETIVEADDEVVETSPLSMTWEGVVALESLPPGACGLVCVPPTLTGDLVLTVNMETYAFQGSVTMAGEGQAAMARCDSEDNPTDETCTATGTALFTGSFSGVTDRTGAFTVDFQSAGEINRGWVAGCGAPTSETFSVENTISISGTFNWDGTSNGTITLDDTWCDVTGEWSAELVAIEYPPDPEP